VRAIRRFAPCALIAAAVCANSASSAEYTLTTLATFNGANGASPTAALIADAAGNLYGTTEFGDPNGSGTAFQVAADTHALTTLVNFDNVGGQCPYAGLIADASGNFYGTTLFDSAIGSYGAVYRLAAGTYEPTIVVSFGYTNGSKPRAGLIADASGNLYGTTQRGGEHGYGTVFEVASGTSTVTTLASFSGVGSDGAIPSGALIVDAAGNLYGTTADGGPTGDGTVYEVDASTHAVSILATFNHANGTFPYSALLRDADGNLYGTTEGGGKYGGGTVFEVLAGTHSLITLATFNGANGLYPAAALIADSIGNLFGTTTGGGLNGDGTVFELSAATHAIITLATFNGMNGANPYAGLMADASGDLYGTTFGGGEFGVGTLFELSPTPEPSSLTLSLAAFVACAFWVWKRRRLQLTVPRDRPLSEAKWRVTA
jgi:uncharacterized repeat protein (TIGR03803 family)